MAGNREAYLSYMDAGHNAAWDHDWQAAIKAYTLAAKEFAEDPDAHIYLGLALLRAGRLEDALKVYNRAHQLAPDDPTPLEKSADILERMGRLKEAAQHYVRVSEVYIGLRDLDKAIGNWSRATQLTPGLTSIHAKLAQAYERIGDKRKAIREYLTLAFNFRREGDVNKAIKAVERALRLDRNNPQALNIMTALRSGADINFVPDSEPAPRTESRFDDDMDFSAPKAKKPDVGEANPLGPMGEAMTLALVRLAEYVVESGLLDLSGASALQAMELQRQENYPGAIDAYRKAESSLRHPALKMNLGGLLVLTEQYADATKHLAEVMIDPALTPGALHGLGIAYYQMGRQKQASKFLIQSLQAVDASLAVDENEEAELNGVYDRLFTALEDANDDAMKAINQRFVSLLSGADWKQRIAETRRVLDEIMRTGDDVGVRDYITSASDELTESVARIDRYIRQNYLTLAMDEAHRAVETSPYYLPIHVRMAEIMMREGRVRQAINKYNMVARAYLVRDEVERAASILTEVLELAPLDVSLRQSLIELLEGQERWQEVLQHYVGLGDTYNQLGNFDQARDTFNQAERLGRRINAPAETMAGIKFKLAELDMMRLDVRRAQKAYEEIAELLPQDERPFRALVDIYYNQGNQLEATRRLDQLLGIYARRKQVSKIINLLEDLVRTYPKDGGLRSRLAGIYRQLGRKEEAIEQLDALGELQLEAGLHRDAVNTIRQIIRLQPENLEDYKRLLSQLGG